MSEFLSVVLGLCAVALLIPAFVLLAECLLALSSPPPKGMVPRGTRPRIAILVPAHDEEVTIQDAVRSISPQLGPRDRLVVIADNCADKTAELARGAGASVIERHDPERTGKGYALDFGLRHLSEDPPEVVVMFDADCTASPDAIELIARRAMEWGRPIQAKYEMRASPGNDPLTAVSGFAFLVKNVVRPSGLDRLGLPCALTGTGMAFPWAVIRKASLAGEQLVEDMQLGLELAIAGHPPAYCAEASVTSRLPEGRKAQAAQRRRWEHGHLMMLITQTPRLIAAACRQRRLDLLVMALDLAVPPLSLLVIAGATLMVLSLIAGALGASWVPAGLLALCGLIVATAILSAWIGYGHKQFSLSTLLIAPLYVLWKAPLYINFLGRRQKRWIRTERGGHSDPRRLEGSGIVSSDTEQAGKLPVVHLRGVRFHAITRAQCVEHVMESLDAGRGGWLGTANIDHLRRLVCSQTFKTVYDTANLVVADGMPLVWASRLQGTPLPERVAGSDLLGLLGEKSAAQGRSVFMLGGAPGTAEAAARVLGNRYPGIRVAGTFCPAPGFERNESAMAELTKVICAAAPDVVFVALGSPKQEELIARLRGKLPRSWWLPVGISFSFMSGEIPRAPRWMQHAGIEWLHRLCQEPGRLFRRYIVEDLPFAVALLAGIARQRAMSWLRGRQAEA